MISAELAAYTADAYEASRPNGAKFWHELPDADRERLLSLAVALERRWREKHARLLRSLLRTVEGALAETEGNSG